MAGNLPATAINERGDFLVATDESTSAHPLFKHKTAKILVVDDNPTLVELLTLFLNQCGYQVRTAASGLQAFDIAADFQPDLILLDINMSGLGGYQVCSRLKADPRYTDVPVIFISGNCQTEDIAKGFAAGAVDYLTKPIITIELEVRIHTHLELYFKKKQLEEHNERLRRLEIMRDNLVHMLVHDMRSPLTCILAATEFVLLKDKNTLSEDSHDSMELVLEMSRKIIRMVSEILDVSKLEEGKTGLNITTWDMTGLLVKKLEEWRPQAADRQFILEVPAEPIVVHADCELITRVIENLLSNATKYSPSRSTIRAGLQNKGGQAHVYVSDSGQGLSNEQKSVLFQKFGQVAEVSQGVRFSSGLGLYFSKLVLEAHHGRIGMDSEEGKGSTFWFEIPVK